MRENFEVEKEVEVEDAREEVKREYERRIAEREVEYKVGIEEFKGRLEDMERELEQKALRIVRK
jgi:hypothetical protein